jgi:hypothetical protein
MSLKANAARLTAVTRELSNRWEETKYFWRDTKSLEFEKRHLEDFFPMVERTVALMEQLDKLLTKIKNDCE